MKSVERYAHLAPDHLANAAARLEVVVSGSDLATDGGNRKGLHRCKPLVVWLPDLDSNQGPAD